MSEQSSRAPRYLSCAPVGVKNDAKERTGLIRDASASGALVYSRSAFPLEEALTLKVHVSEEQIVDIVGVVVRAERLHDGLWVWALGVKFEPPRTDLEPLFAQLAQRMPNAI
jgi:PilZ domain